MDLVNIGIIITYLMIFGAALAVVGFSVMQMMKNPSNAKKTIYSLGSLIVVLALGYVLASSEVLPAYEKYGVNAGAAKRVGMGLNAFYFLAIGAIGAVIYSEFGKAFKK